jgi:hypothetical protein
MGIKIVLELDTKTNNRVIHKIKTPEYNEKLWYVTVVSSNAFFYSLKKRNRKGNILYIGKSFEEWTYDQEHRAKNPIIADLDERLLTPIEHESLWDFYKYIGWDYKKKKYMGD